MGVQHISAVGKTGKGKNARCECGGGTPPSSPPPPPRSATGLEIHIDWYRSSEYIVYILYITGERDTSPVLDKLCGSEVHGQSITSTGTSIRINFHSDISIERTGFKFRYRTVDRSSKTFLSDTIFMGQCCVHPRHPVLHFEIS